MFKQFPEYKWNKADVVLEDASQELDSMINLKSLRFTIIPDLAYSADLLKSYLEKIEKLSNFFSKYCDETVRIRVDVEAFEKLMTEETTARQSEQSFKARQVINTLWLRDKNTPQPRWIYFKHEELIKPGRVFHMSLHWMACDSWLTEELVTLLFRRSTSISIRVVQTSEFFYTDNLQLNPFRAQPLICVTAPTTYLSLDPAAVYAPVATVIERLYFVQAPEVK